MVILQCLVFDWILVNVFKVDVEHYWPLNADVTVYGSFTVTSDGRGISWGDYPPLRHTRNLLKGVTDVVSSYRGIVAMLNTSDMVAFG